MTAMVLVCSLLACRSRVAAPEPPQPQSCLDRQLAQRGLNPFGDAPGTVYAGGSPLFDEKSGRTLDRTAYISARHPEIVRACDAGP